MTDAGRVDVALPDGVVRGERRDGVRVFTGIPFAAPPVGPLRFAAPQPPRPWTQPHDATRWAPRSLQPTEDADGHVGHEDCLYVNVYAPADPGSYPVMAWIHGGGAIVGSPNDCDGTALAAAGIVVVTIGYRLGALGLLHLPGVFGEEVEGNFALLDQQAALRWVQRSIAAFDGDPDRVTVAGLSNGGRSVGTLMGRPSADGLFAQAVVMSGTGVGRLVAHPDEAAEVTDAMLQALGLDRRSASALRDLPAERILAAQRRVQAAWPHVLPFQVVVDGTTLPSRPIDALRAGATPPIPTLVGTTHDEYDGFVLAATAAGVAPGPSIVAGEGVVERARSAYRGLLDDGWSDHDVRCRVVTDADWWIPAVRLAEAQADRGAPTWMYRIDWRLAPRGTGIGAPHGMDGGLLQPDEPGHRELLALAHDPEGLTAIIDELRAALIGFVSRGAPCAAAGRPWPRYDTATRSTFLLDRESGAIDDPDRALRVVWRDLL